MTDDNDFYLRRRAELGSLVAESPPLEMGKDSRVPYLLDIFYLLLLLAALPWLAVQAVRKGKYRQGYAAKFLGLVPRRSSQRPCVWLHAVSVGEVNLLAPLLKMIAQERPDVECVISTTTMTGMALAKKKYPELSVFYCPLDFSWAVRAALGRIRPDVLVLAELELWPNLVWAARRRGARLAVVNGRLSEHSFAGYRRIRGLVGRLLRQINLLAVQDATYARRFEALGARRESMHVTGSMKYDGAATDRGNPATLKLAALAGFQADDVIFLAGSTQEPEEAVAIEVFRRLQPAWPKLRLVLVPRHPDRFGAVAKLLEASGLAWRRRSELAGDCPDFRVNENGTVPFDGPSPAHVARVLLVDAVGELGAWWGTAQIAFVGGSLSNRGGQNMIEPAAYGAAVSFGPNTRNFRDIVAAMLACQAAVVVADGDELFRFVCRCLEDPAYAAALGSRGRALVLQQLGATERTWQLLSGLIGGPGDRGRGE
jgi:3-deoxy-D-manno-octulosonic-acid transferase